MDIRDIMDDAQGVGRVFPYNCLFTSMGADCHILDIKDGNIAAVSIITNHCEADCRAFMTGFREYSYQEVRSEDYTLAWWVFRFPFPLNHGEAIFHAQLADQEGLQHFLESDSCTLSSFLLERQIQLMPRVRYELDPRAIDIFKATIVKQLSEPFELASYFNALWKVQDSNGVKRMFKRGVRFADNTRRDPPHMYFGQ